MSTPGSRRPTGRALVSGLAGAVAAVGVVVLGGQLLGGPPEAATASRSIVAIEAADAAARARAGQRPGRRRGRRRAPGPAAHPRHPAAPAAPAADRTQDRASRSDPRSGSGSSGSGSGSGTRPPSSGGGGSTASQVISLVNAARADAGLRPGLGRTARSTSAAQAHSADMAANDYFSHTSQDGRSFADRIRAAGYSGGAMAENIAAGQSSASSVMAGWMDSPGHRANILNCTYRHIGVGVAKGGSYGTYWTQDFGG